MSGGEVPARMRSAMSQVPDDRLRAGYLSGGDISVRKHSEEDAFIVFPWDKQPPTSSQLQNGPEA